jgi:RNA polymerase sigma-70 factor (ECF subfamily)
LRSRKSREALSDPLDEESEVFAASETGAIDARIDIAALLTQLPERHRLPIIHVKLNGLSVQEAALETGMSESAIKVGIHRGLKALALRIRGRS